MPKAARTLSAALVLGPQDAVSTAAARREDLREVDKERQANEGIKAFWGIDRISDFTNMVRTNPQAILDHGQQTADFTTMYTSFPFEAIIKQVGTSMGEAFLAWATKHPYPEGSDAPSLRLGPQGFNRLGEGYKIYEVHDLLKF
eukprot:RCo005438